MKTPEVFPSMTLAHLQQQFNELFPHLRIESIIELASPERTLNAQTTEDMAGYSIYTSFVIEVLKICMRLLIPIAYVRKIKQTLNKAI